MQANMRKESMAFLGEGWFLCLFQEASGAPAPTGPRASGPRDQPTKKTLTPGDPGSA